MQALQNNKRRDFVHLAYLDDSDTKSKVNKWQVMAGVIIEDDNFTLLEMAMGVVREILLRSGNLEHFHEFHTCELFGGHGIFQGIEERERISAIWKLLSLLKTGSLPVVYGAVDLTSLNKQIYASADPLDISFRMCLAGIEQWIKADIVKRSCAGDDMTKLTPEEIGTRVLKAGYFHSLVMVIVDDCEDKRRKRSAQVVLPSQATSSIFGATRLVEWSYVSLPRRHVLRRFQVFNGDSTCGFVRLFHRETSRWRCGN